MTETETIAAAINQIDEKKQKLKKAFEDLQSHRSLLSPSFSLSWSDIDSHFSSLQSSLSNRLHLLQYKPPSDSRIETDEAEAPVILPELRSLCEKNDAIGLTKFLIDRWNDDAMPNLELSAAFRYSPDPASMVLDAIDGGGSSKSPASGKSIDVRRVFVLLLEALIDIDDKNNITLNTKERAKKVADDWNTKIGSKPFEALLFLHLVAAFELGSSFKSEELSRYVLMIAKYKQATLVCNKICLGKERVGEIITKLLSSGKPILAVRFMYECGRTDGFEPISVLKSYVKESREAAERVRKEDNYSLKSQNEATDKEVSALKAVIKIIKDQGLEGEFSEERVEERVEELEKGKAQRKRQQEQQPKGRKRPRDRSGGAQAPRQEAIVMPPSHHHGLQLNPFGVVNIARGGVLGPYMNPLAAGLYGPAPTPQPVYYGQQAGFVMPPFHPSKYPQ